MKMKKLRIISHLYKQVYLTPYSRNIGLRLYRKICRLLYRLTINFVSDPIISVKVGQKNLYMNASHKLPLIKASLPYYDTALPRLGSFLKGKQGYLNMIDVGANIGDTVSLITESLTGDFLCVEADEMYFQLLLMNTKTIQNVVCENILVSDVEGVSNLSLVQVRGTSHVSENTSGDPETLVTTIDKLVEKHQVFSKANLIKVDTDGYDYKVLRGCKQLINESRPVVYFELSPWFLTVAGEDPVSIFDYFFSSGYSSALFYDYSGFPLIMINTRETELIYQLLNYADIKENFYYDVLLFHDSKNKDFQEFYKKEIEVFPKYEWVGE